MLRLNIVSYQLSVLPERFGEVSDYDELHYLCLHHTEIPVSISFKYGSPWYI